MPTSTYTALAKVTLSSSDSSITFSSIPNTYRDIVISMSIKNSSTSGGPFIRFNSDTGNNYIMVQMANDGVNTPLFNTGTTNYGWLSPNSNFSSTSFDNIEVNIFDYSTTDKQTTYLSRMDAPNSGVYHNALAVRWNSTAVINTIEVATTANAFAAGSTIGLFGIEA